MVRLEEAQEGWEERSLSCIANFLNGLSSQKYTPKNELKKLPVLKIRELSGGISESSDWATSEVKPEFIVEAGDVIFAWSASLMVGVWDGEKCVLNQHLFKVTSSDFPTEKELNAMSEQITPLLDKQIAIAKQIKIARNPSRYSAAQADER